MKGYLAYSGTQGLHSTRTDSAASALSRARTRSMLTLIPRPVPGGEPQPPATPKRQRKPKTSNTDAVEYGWMPSYYRAAA
jgi:hypothetical protein